jgi:hypothetical protein
MNGPRIYSVQSKTHLTSSSTASTLSTTLDQKPTKGNVVVAAIATFNGYGNIDASVNTITQTGVDWNRKEKKQTANKVFDIEIWAGKVTSTNASQSLTITLFNATSQGIIAEVFEYNGISTDIDGSDTNYKDSVDWYPIAGENGVQTHAFNPVTEQYRDCLSELWIGATFAYDYPQTETAATDGFTLYDGQRNSSYNSLAYLEKKVYDNNGSGLVANTGTYCDDPNHSYGLRPWLGCIVAFKSSKLISDDYNCAYNQPENFNASKGVTIWGAKESYDVHLAVGESKTISFTGTHPRGYGGVAVCNATWTLQIDNNSPGRTTDVRLLSSLNNQDIGPRIHSIYKDHDVTEGYDISQVGSYIDDGSAVNQITFTNNSLYSDVGFTVKNIRILRVYSICDLGADYCENDRPEEFSSASGTLDYQREDYPCNCESCGEQYSFTTFGPDSSKGSILNNGESKTWTFVNPPSKIDSNYVGSVSCLFNFNNLILTNQPSGNDAQYTIAINGNPIDPYYHSKVLNVSQFPTVELANYPFYYNDAPGASNTITITNNSTASFALPDGTEKSDPGRINIYRIYRTTNNNQDAFTDNATDAHLWNILQTNGGSIDEINSKLRVNIPSGSGWAEAGYVSKYYHNMQQKYGAFSGFTAKVDVIADQQSPNILDQMELLISNNKYPDSNPYNGDNWYRIVKGKRCYSTNVLSIENKINNNNAQKYLATWASSTGTLKIAGSRGSIAFYENGTMRYAEPFALPYQNCYVYAFASSERSVSAGTEYFDNFEVTPTDAFTDNFGGSLAGWTIDQGTWQLNSGWLESSQANSYIHTNTAFSTNRHVKADMRTLSPVGGATEVLRLYVSMINGYNNIYVTIRRDNKVELTIWSGGTCYSHPVPYTINPLAQHTVAVSIIGINAKVWVDGTLVINLDDAHLADATVANGCVGMCNFYSTGVYTNLVVLDE